MFLLSDFLCILLGFALALCWACIADIPHSSCSFPPLPPAYFPHWCQCVVLQRIRAECQQWYHVIQKHIILGDMPGEWGACVFLSWKQKQTDKKSARVENVSIHLINLLNLYFGVAQYKIGVFFVHKWRTKVSTVSKICVVQRQKNCLFCDCVAARMWSCFGATHSSQTSDEKPPWLDTFPFLRSLFLTHSLHISMSINPFFPSLFLNKNVTMCSISCSGVKCKYRDVLVIDCFWFAGFCCWLLHPELWPSFWLVI